MRAGTETLMCGWWVLRSLTGGTGTLVLAKVISYSKGDDKRVRVQLAGKVRWWEVS